MREPEPPPAMGLRRHDFTQVVNVKTGASYTVYIGADELAICRGCYEAAAHIGRLSRGHPIRFDLEQLT